MVRDITHFEDHIVEYLGHSPNNSRDLGSRYLHQNRPETHTFHLPRGECTITLEDVTIIFGLPTNGLSVSGFTDTSSSSLENEFMIQFATIPIAPDHKGSGVKLA
ncbi:hypothetical protein Ahy_B05g078098 [Arachis hypogaea]|uniref:Aminotransferase-like plant mobile domain-containing protein n=1 Tax=Arachis hypogaea TaxID=3818 RepID=A0A444Z6B6_ARAHY|nr:hypothetical protein Ahy_B05g078098 [Arachis hypogaea]